MLVLVVSLLFFPAFLLITLSARTVSSLLIASCFSSCCYYFFNTRGSDQAPKTVLRSKFGSSTAGEIFLHFFNEIIDLTVENTNRRLNDRNKNPYFRNKRKAEGNHSSSSSSVTSNAPRRPSKLTPTPSKQPHEMIDHGANRHRRKHCSEYKTHKTIFRCTECNKPLCDNGTCLDTHTPRCGGVQK